MMTTFDRYSQLRKNGEIRLMPGIKLDKKHSDYYEIYRSGFTRLDILSNKYYGSPGYWWLILLANPEYGSMEFEIPNNSEIRIMECCECGNEFEMDMEYLDSMEQLMVDNEICEDCFHDKYAFCELCEEWEIIDNMTSVEKCSNNETMLICEHCLDTDSEIFYCEYHEQYEYDDYEDSIYVENYGRICQNAYDWSGDFCWCDGCDNCFYIDDIHWDEDDECSYCDNCYDEYCGDRVIGNYHNNKDDYEYSKLMTQEEREEGGERTFFGMEIEVEGVEYRGWSYKDKNEVATELNDLNNSFVYENDGS